MGSQSDFTVNPKYGKKKTIKGGIPTIILCNPDDDWAKECRPAQWDYIEANTVIHYMYEGETFIAC